MCESHWEIITSLITFHKVTGIQTNNNETHCKAPCKYNTLSGDMQEKKKKKDVQSESSTPWTSPSYKYHAFQTYKYKDLSLAWLSIAITYEVGETKSLPTCIDTKFIQPYQNLTSQNMYSLSNYPSTTRFWWSRNDSTSFSSTTLEILLIYLKT